MFGRLSLILCLLLVFACTEQSSEPTVLNAPSQEGSQKASGVTESGNTSVLLREPVDVRLLEVPNEALTVWRRYRDQKPTLILVSDEPLLQPVPEPLRAAVGALIAEGSDAALLERTSRSHSDPLLAPSMTLRAALDSGLLGRIVWILPSRPDESEIVTQEQLSGFIRKFEEEGLLSAVEAQSFRLEGQAFAGMVGGSPVVATSLHELPKVDAPALLHLDVGYFSPIFKGGTKTPLYPLIWDVFERFRSAGWPIAEATISLSNLSEKMPLSGRFIGKDLVRLMRHPDLMNQSLPGDMEKRGQILYMQQLFQKEAIRTMYLEMEQADPEDASVLYGLYLVHRQFDDPQTTLDYLARAVQMDSVYGLEYLELARIARDQGLEKENLEMIRLASEALKDNPFIKIDLARALLRNGEPGQAFDIIRQLQSLHWSQVYFPEVPELLMLGAEYAEKAKAVHGNHDVGAGSR